jgi:hypothetical protein
MDIYVEGELQRASFDAVAEFGFRVGGSLSFDIVMSVSERSTEMLFYVSQSRR